MNKIAGVLLDDGWHSVQDGSFEIDNCVFGELRRRHLNAVGPRETQIDPSDGAHQSDGAVFSSIYEAEEMWFRFREGDAEIAGPFWHILAIR